MNPDQLGKKKAIKSLIRCVFRRRNWRGFGPMYVSRSSIPLSQSSRLIREQSNITPKSCLIGKPRRKRELRDRATFWLLFFKLEIIGQGENKSPKIVSICEIHHLRPGEE